MTEPADPAALIAHRAAAHAERARVSDGRWKRFQDANRKRYAGREKRRLPQGLVGLMARAKTPGRIFLLRTSGVWDPQLDVSLGSVPGPAAALEAYVQAGPDAAFQPRALFDQSWYLGRAPALTGSRWPPLAHYLVVGDSHNLSPYPLLDGPFYRARHGAAMSTRRLTALEHFLFLGAAEGANPHPLFDVRHYVGQSEAVAESGENPLIHYLRVGWRQGLDPHPLFAGDWYLERNPAARASGVAPLLDYVVNGAIEGLDPHPLFDTAAYRRQRFGVSGADALTDFLASGARGARSPTPHFNPTYYREQAGDRPLANANPLLHYLTLGAFEGLWPAPDFDEAGYFAAHPSAVASPLSGLDHWARHRTERPKAVAASGRAVSAEALLADLRRATAPDPEAYGVAAYEALRRPRVAASPSAPPSAPVRVIALRRTAAPDWVAVARALPSFRGQVQPRLPADGFTDPADPATLARDIALARRYGLAGFCHEIAEVEAAIPAGAADFPFCLAWTGPRAARVIPALASPHAIKIDGRSVLLLPRDADLAAWRKTGDLFLVQRGGKPVPGFDAHLADTAPARLPEGPPGPVINPDFRGSVHDALALVGERVALPLAPNAFPVAIAGLDTTPRSPNAPVVWQGACPGALQAWVEAAGDAVRSRAADRRLVFVHAWNDWESGAALSPDLRFGHGWLEAIANAADADLLAPPR